MFLYPLRMAKFYEWLCLNNFILLIIVLILRAIIIIIYIGTLLLLSTGFQALFL